MTPLNLLSDGIAMHQAGKLDDAIRCYEQALALDPRMFAALNNMAAALNRQGKTEAAIAYWRRGVFSCHLLTSAARNSHVQITPLALLLRDRYWVRAGPGSLFPRPLRGKIIEPRPVAPSD